MGGKGFSRLAEYFIRYYTIWLAFVKMIFVPFWELEEAVGLSAKFSGLKDSVIGLARGVIKGGEDILGSQKRIILKNFFERRSRTE